ncbi:hypothetical protein BRETT_001719 [Brettanomyces bruxellensis]|uniref:Centromere protein H C-terminal domain-containing protein n=1 Tax=Dekkera bruxellensis TaxID=5007 RepID=A0A871R6B6_DEKBR|nr:uncharacterized protein BRETT_001719 [Brettanomyces bruxellensis]QOU18652.1 hypothetical protein BRETT_001719 [Brettanomyces bruxellensis]
MSEISEDTADSDSSKKNVRKLEIEHAQTYRELVSTIDNLIQQTVKNNGFNEIDKDEKFRETIQENESLVLGTLHQNLINGVSTDANFNDRKNLESIASFLRQLIRIRRLIIEQRLVTSPILKTTYTERDFRNTDAAHDNDLSSLIKENDKNNIEAAKLIQQNFKLEENLGHLREISAPKLKLLRDKVARDRKLSEVVNSMKGKEKDMLSTREYEKLKNKYKSLVRKDKILSQFNINLISSLSKADMVNDQRLTDMILFCGDYSDYSALSDEESS